MFITSSPGPSRIQRLDIRVKVLGFLALMVLAFLFENPFYNLVILLLVQGIAMAAQFPLKKINGLVRPLLPLFFMIICFTALATVPDRFHLAANRAILWQVLPGQLEMTLGGIMLGLTFLLRTWILVASSAMFIMIAPLDDLLQWFQKLKLPYAFSFMILTAIRFIPTLDRKRLLILDAQQARGADFEKAWGYKLLRTQIPVMVSLMIHAIVMADGLSMAMLNRGFGYAATRTNPRDLRFTPADYWAALVIFMVMGGALYLQIGRRLGRL